MNRPRFSQIAFATAVFVAASLALASTSAGRTWTPASTVARCHCLGFPALTSFAGDGSIVAWDEGDRLIALRVHRDGKLGRRRTLAKGTNGLGNALGEEGAWIATGRSGSTVAVWEHSAGGGLNGGIRARRLTRGGKLGRIHRIAGPAGGELDAAVAVDPAGNATIAWSRVFTPSSQDHGTPRTTARVRRLSAKGHLGRTVTLSLARETNDHPRVAAAPSGRATVVWRSCCPTNSIGATMLDRNGRVTAVRGDISDPGGGGEPEVAMDARGNAIVVWAAGQAMMARGIQAGGGVGPLQVLGSVESSSDAAPRVAFDRSGNASVVWRDTDTIQLRLVGPDGALGPLTKLSEPPGPHLPGLAQVQTPAVTVDLAGTTMAAWSKVIRNPDLSHGGTALQVRGVAPTGELGPIRTLSSSPEGSSRTKIVTDTRGVVTVAWGEFSPEPFRATIRVARLVRR